MIVTVALLALYVFQSTHPLRGATYRRAYGGWRCGISIHAPLAGCDRRFCILVVSVGYFNPRTPCGVRPPRPRAIQRPWAFQSTHPLRGATGVQVNTQTVEPKFQSTHPLRGATRGERPLLWIEKFQSTHPLRGATIFWLVKPSILVNFNPRTPCGVRQRTTARRNGWKNFNPRTPCGVRHVVGSQCPAVDSISIHAPLAGCDHWPKPCEGWKKHISIHAPLAGCDDVPAGCCATVAVISIHAPLAGCDRRVRFYHRAHGISIHAPLAGCDGCVCTLMAFVTKFQSTHPLRGATTGLLS